MKQSQPQQRCFIVEDDPIYCKLIKYVFELDPENEIHIFSSGKECIDHLHLNPQIISLDYSLPDVNGKTVLENIKNYNKDIEVIMLSGQKDISVAVELLRDGAFDYIVKDNETKDHLFYSLQKLSKNLRLRAKVEQLEDELVDKYAFEKTLIGNSSPMQEVFRLIQKAVKTSISVSITGETGTGKEIAARSIHFNSERRKGSFIAVNVSALPKDLLESELFGYEKGAFTGAYTRKLGTFELADKGTLFLDEIAEIDLSMQAKLLRALQEREIVRIGGSKPIPFDTRIIVATHSNLSAEVEAGRFREDLYYRLLGLPIEMPPLRNRGNDMLLLMKHFIEDFSKANKLGKIKISNAAEDKLLSYSFPGNVRELKAIVELACVMAEENIIEAHDIRFNSPKRTASFLTQELSLKQYNEKIIYHFLEKYNNNILLVADKLKIGKSTIYRMLKEVKQNQ